MRLNRFFMSEKLGAKGSMLVASVSTVNQIKNVFRLKIGDDVILFDGSGDDFLFSIEEYRKEGVLLTLIEKRAGFILPKKEMYLFMSLVKKDNFELIAQKATELGVSHIIPIISERSEKKNLNKERMEKIIIEAAEQSGRATIPAFSEIIDLKSALANFSRLKPIAWHPSAIKFVSQDLGEVTASYIGPEGGWSSTETDLFKKFNIPLRSLGPQTLRAETATVGILSRLVF